MADNNSTEQLTTLAEDPNQLEGEEFIEESGKKRKKFDLTLKVKVLDFVKSHSKNQTAEHFHIDRSQIYQWLKKEAEIRKLSQKNTVSHRVSGGGRKELSEELNKSVAEWICAQREQRKRISRRIIKRKAQEIGNKLVSEGKLKLGDGKYFKASNGWLSKFMKRNNFVLRRVTTQCQKVPAELQQKLVDFIVYIRNLRKSKGYAHGFTYAADETAVWLDPAALTCIETRGAKEVAAQSTGHEKLNITVMLAARDDGKKCPPFVIMNRKRPIPEVLKKFQGKLVIAWPENSKSWMTSALAMEWIRKVFGKLSFQPRLLVWDAFSGHRTPEVLEELRSSKIDVAVVPAGCTKFVQPPDVSWNRPFKLRMREYHEDWLLSGEKSYTSGGNMRAPSPEIYLQWVVNAWESVTQETIMSSFKYCGISNANNGSEDHMIQAFKNDGACPEGKELLQKRIEEEINEQNIDEEEMIEDSDNSDLDSDYELEY